MTLIEQALENAALKAVDAATVMKKQGAKPQDYQAVYWHATKLFELMREYEKETA